MKTLFCLSTPGATKHEAPNNKHRPPPYIFNLWRTQHVTPDQGLSFCEHRNKLPKFYYLFAILVDFEGFWLISVDLLPDESSVLISRQSPQSPPALP